MMNKQQRESEFLRQCVLYDKNARRQELEEMTGLNAMRAVCNGRSG